MEQLNQGRYSTLEVRERAVEAISRGLHKGEVAEAYGIDMARRKKSATFAIDTKGRVEV